eukprot:gnl/Spiro4/28733_TR14216_c0_g1_i1.p1 gnl/Spiro4/28733_TR14216_c0_g1~~gnl/Spiro4/28733_TR14216_c0_g1_i1.p1  ORF type:complete len:257 (-),score=62.27 gnl/Spiro4/28733_TR14216_c0_g1_i1:48-818(-)
MALHNVVFLLVAVVVAPAALAATPITVARCAAALHPAGNWSTTTRLRNFSLAEIRPLQRATQQTTVHICHTDTALHMRFDCADRNPVSRFTQCNDPLYEDSVVEAFITATTTTATTTKTTKKTPDIDIHHYLELEVSPNGVLFASRITNPSLDCPGFTGEAVPCAAPGLAFEAHKDTARNTWWAYLSVPFSLLNPQETPRVARASPSATYFRANFFRIDSPVDGNKEYSAWRSPRSVTVPCFHVPSAFAEFVLSDM